MRHGKILLILATASLALPASAWAVRSTHSGWFWGDPRPQGQTLHGVAFAGPTGYATGDFGTLLKSVDAGHTWRGLATGLTESLRSIDLLSAKSLIVGGTCALRRSDDGGKTFRRLPWTASDTQCYGGIQAFDFPSPNVGLLVLGNGNVLRSIDAGRTWSRRTAVPGTSATSSDSRVEPTDLTFISETIGFATTSGGDIFVTTDAGNTWKAVVAEPWAIRSITFASAKVGYAAGDAPAVLKTIDGGQTWTEFPLPSDAGGLAQLRCASPEVCLGVTPDGARLARTTDGGVNWESLAPSSVSLQAVGLPSVTQAIGIGQDGTTVFSSDAGNTFTPITSALTGTFSGLSAQSAKVAYAFGDGGSLARTTDAGRSWQEIDAATSNDVTGVSFVSAKVGFVLDSSGQLLRTDNGGDSYEILDTGSGQISQTVRALDSKRVLLIGPLGVRRSTDGGRTFKPNVQKKVRSAPLFDVARLGTTLLAYGPRAILISHDGGQHFATMRRPGRPGHKVRVNNMVLTGPRNALLLDARGPLYRTDDAGRHWHELAALGTDVGFNMQFADARHGWVAVTEFGSERGAWLMRTNDGGSTWEPQLIDSSPLRESGVAAGSSTIGFALTDANGLFATGTSGSAGKLSSIQLTSPTKLVRKAGDAVRLNGKLSGAVGGEHVVVSFRDGGSTRWLFQDVVVASNGTFTVVARVRGDARFVAQWAGNAARRGAGSSVLKIGVKPKVARGSRGA